MWSYVSLYACNSKELLDVEGWFERRPIREEYLIVDGGKLAARTPSYTAGDATRVRKRPLSSRAHAENFARTADAAFRRGLVSAAELNGAKKIHAEDQDGAAGASGRCRSILGF